MPRLGEILRSLYGAWRLLILDRHGILAFDGTRSAAVRSFWVAVVVLPLIIALDTIPPVQGNGGAARLNLWLLVADFILRWLLPLIVFYGLIRWYGRGERYWLLVAVLNWSQIPQALLLLLETALLLGAGRLVDLHTLQGGTELTTMAGNGMALLALLIYVAVYFYEWFVSWIALEAGIALPTAVLLFDLVIGYAIDYGFDRFFPVLTQSGHAG
jgi:hypothetical protein